MENLSLLQRFANPDLLQNMTLGEKLLASTYVAVLGMAITFIALMILWGCIIIMGNALGVRKPKKEPVKVAPEPKAQPEIKTTAEETDSGDDEELVAVITAAIAASLNTSTHNIVVRNIVRVPDTTPAWGQAGRLEQMNKML
jgi:sodium pump decarboxylase gamma subunit